MAALLPAEAERHDKGWRVALVRGHSHVPTVVVVRRRVPVRCDVIEGQDGIGLDERAQRACPRQLITRAQLTLKTAAGEAATDSRAAPAQAGAEVRASVGGRIQEIQALQLQQRPGERAVRAVVRPVGPDLIIEKRDVDPERIHFDAISHADRRRSVGAVAEDAAVPEACVPEGIRCHPLDARLRRGDVGAIDDVEAGHGSSGHD